jgi:hypothetical protein
MMLALALSALVITADDNDLGPEGAAIGAAVGSALVGVAMFGGLFVATRSDAGVETLLDIRQAAGPVGFPAGVALLSVTSSGLGAGVGYAMTSDDVLGGPHAIVGAMLGAGAGCAVGAIPAVFAFSVSDQTQARPVNGIGDAVATGIVAGLFESAGLLTSTTSAMLLAPPAATAVAFLASEGLE